MPYVNLTWEQFLTQNNLVAARGARMAYANSLEIQIQKAFYDTFHARGITGIELSPAFLFVLSRSITHAGFMSDAQAFATETVDKILMVNPDRGDRYLETIYDDQWLQEQGVRNLSESEINAMTRRLEPVGIKKLEID